MMQVVRYNGEVRWVYLSPHFDDAALSCGGLIWEQARAGDEVSIWTVCAGEPPAGELSPFALQLHARWNTQQNAPAHRKLEDARSCHLLGASTHYFNIPDCIYRRNPKTGAFLYASEEALTGPLHPADAQTITTLQEQLGPLIASNTVLVSPLAMGHHVDHLLARATVEILNFSPWYYQDYPYVLRDMSLLEQLHRHGWSSQVFPVSERGLLAWQDSVAAHTSQISTFYADENAMRRELTEYWRFSSGVQLWRRPA
jgi:LmbE family N-acetylglucosaminyl deacetylase